MTAKKSGVSRFPMNDVERAVGWMYVFVHVFAMRYVLSALNTHVFPGLGFRLDGGWLELLYYAVGAVFLVGFLFHYLKESFADMCRGFTDTLAAVLVGFVVYELFSGLINYVLALLFTRLDPGTAAANHAAKLNPDEKLLVRLLLAPVVEEVLFRGVVFGSLRGRSAVLAYVVSVVFFSFYFVWQDIVFSFSPAVFLTLLRYVPAGLVLGWAYSRAHTVWAPILLHMMINCVTLLVRVG